MMFSTTKPIYRNVEPDFWSKTSFIQIAYGMIASQSGFGVGLSFAFTAVMIPQLKDITTKLSLIEEAFIGSIVTLLAPFGCISGGFLQDKYGRKLILCVGYAPMALGWLCTGTAKSITVVLIGRAITGFGNGMALTSCRTYTTEITLPRMRGVVGVFPDFALALGITTQTLLGAIMTWRTNCYICAIHAIIFCIVHVFIPESPYYILEISSQMQALECLRRLRSKEHDTEREMELLMRFARTCGIFRLSYKQQLALLKREDARRPLCILCGYLILGEFSGLSIFIFSSINILEGVLSSMNEYHANLLIGVCRLIGIIILALLLFTTSRKDLAMISATGVCLFSLCLGLYLQYESSKSFFSVGLLMICTFCAALGYYTLPVLMAFELIPLQIRGSIGGICMAVYFWSIFVANWMYPYLREGLGLACLYMLFSGFALISIFYLFLFLPETKALSLTEIEDEIRMHLRLTNTRVSFRESPDVRIYYPTAHRDSKSQLNMTQDRTDNVPNSM